MLLNTVLDSPVSHPAKFSTTVLSRIAFLMNEIPVDGLIVDPFAGVGGVHQLNAPHRWTVGVELEPEWASQSSQTIVGDALKLPFQDSAASGICTSPSYGNRMADHHDAKDSSKRMTYRHALGRMPTEGSSTVMQWGDEYRTFHDKAWAECCRVLKPQGWFFLNISNHIRGGVEQPVTEWHLNNLISHGLFIKQVEQVSTRRFRHGENREKRADYERIVVAQKP